MAKKTILLLFILLLDTIAMGSTDCSQHPLYCKILKLRPEINKKFAMEMSNIISKKAKKYKTDPIITIAILTQESLFQNIHRYQEVVTEQDVCDTENKCTKQYKIEKVVADVGIPQLNPGTIKNYKFDIDRLMRFDMDYTIDCHMKVLKDKIETCRDLGEDAWTCYHSTIPKLRKEYKRAVKRWMVID